MNKTPIGVFLFIVYNIGVSEEENEVGIILSIKRVSGWCELIRW